MNKLKIASVRIRVMVRIDLRRAPKVAGVVLAVVATAIRIAAWLWLNRHH